MSAILVDGTIAPYLWSGSGYYLGPLIDPGIFSTPGTSLTGLPIHIEWNSDPSITAAITIDGTTVTLGPTAVYANVSPTYQDITVCNCSHNIAVNSYEPTYAAKYNPFGLGGSFELMASTGIPLDGYFYTSSMVTTPAPVSGSLALLPLIVLAIWFISRKRCQATG